MRPELANEGMRMARLLANLAPDEPEVLGLQALLEIQGSRMPARLDDDGVPVLLEAQDRSRWDPLLIKRGLGALQKAELLAARGHPVGRYFLQASIAAQHARAARPRTPTGAGSRSSTTSWRRPRPDRSSRSTGPSRMAGPSTRARGSPSSRRSTPRRSATHHSSRASTATCSSAQGFTPTPRRPSPRRRAHPKRRRTDRPSASRRGEPGPSSGIDRSRRRTATPGLASNNQQQEVRHGRSGNCDAGVSALPRGGAGRRAAVQALPGGAGAGAAGSRRHVPVLQGVDQARGDPVQALSRRPVAGCADGRLRVRWGSARIRRVARGAGTRRVGTQRLRPRRPSAVRRPGE